MAFMDSPRQGTNTSLLPRVPSYGPYLCLHRHGQHMVLLGEKTSLGTTVLVVTGQSSKMYHKG